MLVFFLHLWLVETVTDGGVMVNLTYNGFEIFGDSFDLCFLLSQVGLECPVEPGKYSSGGTVTIPGDLPAVSALQLTMNVI